MTMSIPFDADFASLTDYARLYRQIGLQVVPAYSPAESKSWKRPLLSSWKEFEDALVPDAQFDRWFGPNGSHSSKTNVGIITGSASGGAFILDVDLQTHVQASQWLLALLDEHNGGRALQCPTQRTGGGGYQYLFRAPEGWTSPTIKTPIGIDIRGQGGFAVLPPSRHESGRNYDWVPGHAPFNIEIPVAPDWLVDAINALAHSYGAGGQSSNITTPTPEYQVSPFGQIVDGREQYMTRLVFAAVLNLYRECPILPSDRELTESARQIFTQYEGRVKSRLIEPGTPNHILLEREGRGITLFTQKWKHITAQWDTKVATVAANPPPEFAPGKPPSIDAETGEIITDDFGSIEDLFDLLDVTAIKNLPDPLWLIDKMIIEQSLVLLYSEPGVGKSFLALCISYHIACGLPAWFERPIQKHGPVIYISSEGTADMKFRLMALEQHYGVVADDHPFFLIPSTMNFMAESDIAKLLRTVQKVVEQTAQKPVLLVLDTLSRVLPGAEENLQKDMSLFIRACDLVRETFQCCVMGVHHTSKGGAMRGSTVLAGAGDTVLSLAREEGESDAILTAKKIKAAKDGWRVLVHLQKVACGDLRGTESLVATLGQAEPPEPEGWPDKAVCNAILVAMNAAWEQGQPWSPYPQTRREGRYAPVHLQRLGVAPDVAEKMLEAWAVRKVISVDVVDVRSKIKGYKVSTGVLRRSAEVDRFEVPQTSATSVEEW